MTYVLLTQQQIEMYGLFRGRESTRTTADQRRFICGYTCLRLGISTE